MMGGAGADTFVFSGGQNRVLDFEIGAGLDKVDLKAAAGIADHATLLSSFLSTDGDGNAMISDTAGFSIVLEGVAVSDLTEAHFVF
jgi:hypothetical protein